MRTPLYYGWVNLGIAALAMVATLPGRTQGLGLVTEPLIQDLAIDRVTFASVNLWATLIGALFCLPVGRLVDRIGARGVLVGVLGALALSTIAMSLSAGLVLLAITVTLTRGFGQSALSVVSLALVGKWFSRRLNLAMGVYSLAVGIGFIIAFPSVGQAALAFGWRTSWISVGLVQLLVLAPVAWWLARSGPAAGAGADDTDEAAAGATQAAGAAGPKHDISFTGALRSQAFWVFALSSSVFGLVYSGIALFNQSILEERGFDASTYHAVLVASTMVGLLANLGGGWLAMRWPIQRVMGLGMGALALALVGLPHVSTFTHAMLYGVAMGTAGGIVTVVFFSAWGQVFGRRDLGRIQGAAQMMTVVASAVGPLLLAMTLERTGSYAFIFNLLAVVVLGLGLASWRVTLPARTAPAVGRTTAAYGGAT